MQNASGSSQSYSVSALRGSQQQIYRSVYVRPSQTQGYQLVFGPSGYRSQPIIINPGVFLSQPQTTTRHSNQNCCQGSRRYTRHQGGTSAIIYQTWTPQARPARTIRFLSHTPLHPGE